MRSAARRPASTSAKLANLNGHYIREADDARLAALVEPLIARALGLRLDGELRDAADPAPCRA